MSDFDSESTEISSGSEKTFKGNEPHLMIGEVLGDYQITQVLGSGGMGVVFKARQISLERNVAIKLLSPKKHNKGNLEALKSEARIVAQLRHPNIVSVHALVEERGLLFFVMDYCGGKTLEMILSERMRSLIKSQKLLSLEKTLKYVREMTSALNYAQKKRIIHRDIKPANIIIDDQDSCQVMDFGLARFYTGTGPSSKMVSGTPSYMSPEQTMGQNIGPRSDIFSLGVVFYELLTGQKPFLATSTPVLFAKIQREVPPMPSKINPLLNADIDSVVFVMMEKHPDDRYKTMETCLKDLENLIQKKGSTAYDLLQSIRKKKQSRKSKTKIYPLKRRNRRDLHFLALKKILFPRWLLSLSFLFIGMTLFFYFLRGDKISGPKKFFSVFGKGNSISRELEMAKNFVLIHRGDLAEPILKKILKEHPLNSKEAKKLLIQISSSYPIHEKK